MTQYRVNPQALQEAAQQVSESIKRYQEASDRVKKSVGALQDVYHGQSASVLAQKAAAADRLYQQLAAEVQNYANSIGKAADDYLVEDVKGAQRLSNI